MLLTHPTLFYQECNPTLIKSQRIDFSIDDHDFVMLFTPILESTDLEYLEERSIDVGFDIPDNSYDVKFDRIENFGAGDFYTGPSSGFSHMNYKRMTRLGTGITQLIDFHMKKTKANVYLATAAHKPLKSFYDRLAKQYASQLQFTVISGLGSEGLDYVIKTTHY